MNAKTTLLVTVLMAAGAALAETGHVLPQGTEIKVRTDTPIPAKPVANAKYTATVSDDVLISLGSVGIPRHSREQLVAIPTADRKDTNLDLRSVTVNGHRYLLTAANSNKSTAPGGLVQTRGRASMSAEERPWAPCWAQSSVGERGRPLVPWPEERVARVRKSIPVEKKSFRQKRSLNSSWLRTSR